MCFPQVLLPLNLPFFLTLTYWIYLILKFTEWKTNYKWSKKIWFPFSLAMINKIDQASYGQQHALSIYMYHGPWDNPEEAKGMVSDFEKPMTTLKLSEWPWTPWVDKTSRKSSVARMCTLSTCASLKSLIDPIVTCASAFCLQKCC